MGGEEPRPSDRQAPNDSPAVPAPGAPGRARGVPHDDWTAGPAKWLAAGLISLGALGVGVWSGLTRTPAPHAVYLEPGASGEWVEGADGGAVEPGALAGRPTPEPALAAGRINLNTASRAELDLLPGIGPALADRIVGDREARGPFASIDDLQRVGGIGPRTVERLRELARAD